MGKDKIITENQLKKQIKLGLNKYLSEITTRQQLIFLEFFMNTLTTNEKNDIIKQSLTVSN